MTLGTGVEEGDVCGVVPFVGTHLRAEEVDVDVP